MDDMQRKEIYEQKFRKPAISTASEVLEFLRLSNERWNYSREPNKEWVRSWYFRGQSDANWDLIPKAWRGDKSIQSGRLSPIMEIVQGNVDILRSDDDKSSNNEIQWQRIKYAAEQAVIELLLVKEFIEFADSLGYRIPDTQIPNFSVSEIENLVIGLANNAPNGLHKTIWFDPAFALAQHHGIPTRLMDWTYNPLVAAYFAASDAIEHPPKSNYFAIFAIPKFHFQPNTVRDAAIRRGENNFLVAQQALFLVDINADWNYIKYGRYPDMMSSLFQLGGLVMEHFKPYKLVLHIDQAPELLRLLFLERVTKAHLMPTLDNVASTIKEKWRFLLGTVDIDNKA